jgi:hypothetical protein
MLGATRAKLAAQQAMARFGSGQEPAKQNDDQAVTGSSTWMRGGSGGAVG